MIYNSELQLMCDTFRKCRVQVTLLSAGEQIDQVLDKDIRTLLGNRVSIPVDQLLENAKHNCLLRIRNSLAMTFMVFLLPNPTQATYVSIGPYFETPFSQQELLELAEKYNIPPGRQKLLEEYCAGIPVIPPTSHLFPLLYTFGERLWDNGFMVEELDDSTLSGNEQPANLPQTSIDDVLMNMKLMETRYAAENQMMQAVSRGQFHRGSAILEGISSSPFEKRLDDPLRNIKNYSIVMNTLLRKAAERGGVHPLYLHQTSSAFAIRIEQVPSVKAAQELMSNMFQQYCLLVRKHTTGSYSPTVQRAILMIDSDLASDLSLRALAAAQNISPAYLSNVFKKETGKTVTEYVNTERMELAAQLLESARLQVQTVAQHCGIMDVHYFSKLFKKHTGKTPRQYRQEQNL